MRILLTGSRGTLGIPLKQSLSVAHTVHGIDLTHSNDPTEERCDIREHRQLDHVFHRFRPELCFHFAGEFGRRNGQNFYEQMLSTNILGTRNVIELCVKHNCGLVFASSSEAYGRLADQFDLLKEKLLDTFAPDFHNEYALSKWANERQIRSEDGLRWVILRLFNVYGPGEHYTSYRSVVCQFIHKKLTGEIAKVNPAGRRQFLYVQDFVDTVSRIPDLFPTIAGMTFNVAGTEDTTIQELADKIGVRYELQEEPDNVDCKLACSRLAKRHLYHNPKISLEEGILLTREWMECQRQPIAAAPSTYSTAAMSTCSVGPSSTSTS